MKRMWILLGIGVFVMFGSIGSLVLGTEVYQDGGAAYRCDKECDEQVRLKIPHTAPEFRQAVNECILKNPNCPPHMKKFAQDNLKQISKNPPKKGQWSELDKQMLKNQRCHAECKQMYKKEYGEPQPTTHADIVREAKRNLSFHNMCMDECERRQR